MILNLNGYYGDSTKGEIEYAQDNGKPFTYLYTRARKTISPGDPMTWPTWTEVADKTARAIERMRRRLGQEPEPVPPDIHILKESEEFKPDG